MTDAILEIDGVEKRFGGVHAVDGASFEVLESETCIARDGRDFSAGTKEAREPSQTRDRVW